MTFGERRSQKQNTLRYFPTALTAPRLIKKEILNEPQHEIFNNVVCATSKRSDQPAHTRSLIRAFTSRFDIL